MKTLEECKNQLIYNNEALKYKTSNFVGKMK